MQERPDRGRIIIVNFELGGTAVPPEMRKPSRPCVVLQNNKLLRGPLATVVPLSTSAPVPPGPHHHQMSHLSFRDWPIEWSSDSPRWAKCDYVTTVALDRCHDPYHRIAYGGRRYVRVKAAKVDIEAIDRCVLWALGIDPAKYVPIIEPTGPPPDGTDVDKTDS
jgi:mRNA interferase MazF